MLYYLVILCVPNIIYVNGEIYVTSNNTFELSCPDDEVLQISSAYYGDRNITECNATISSNCSVINFTGIIALTCDFKTNCSGNVTIEDASNGTKYWTINSTCVNASSVVIPNRRCGRHSHHSFFLCDCLNQCQTPGFSCFPLCTFGCVCNPGYRKDPITKMCVGEDYCAQGSNLNRNHEEFSECANHQPKCRGEHVGWWLSRCIPGYRCVSGYVRESLTGSCVRPDECTRSFPRYG